MTVDSYIKIDACQGILWPRKAGACDGDHARPGDQPRHRGGRRGGQACEGGVRLFQIDFPIQGRYRVGKRIFGGEVPFSTVSRRPSSVGKNSVRSLKKVEYRLRSFRGLKRGSFDQQDLKNDNRPLADRMRPRNLDEYVGQGHLLGVESLLRRAVAEDRLSRSSSGGLPDPGRRRSPGFWQARPNPTSSVSLRSSPA